LQAVREADGVDAGVGISIEHRLAQRIGAAVDQVIHQEGAEQRTIFQHNQMGYHGQPSTDPVTAVRAPAAAAGIPSQPT
jgi:hypothetical protein